MNNDVLGRGHDVRDKVYVRMCRGSKLPALFFFSPANVVRPCSRSTFLFPFRLDAKMEGVYGRPCEWARRGRGGKLATGGRLSSTSQTDGLSGVRRAWYMASKTSKTVTPCPLCTMTGHGGVMGIRIRREATGGVVACSLSAKGLCDGSNMMLDGGRATS